MVIRTGGPDANPAYALRSVAGSDQLACATRAEAEKLARAYAEHAPTFRCWRAAPPTCAVAEIGRGRTMIERARIEAVLNRIRPEFGELRLV